MTADGLDQGVAARVEAAREWLNYTLDGEYEPGMGISEAIYRLIDALQEIRRINDKSVQR